jgi:hypothetical protein
MFIFIPWLNYTTHANKESRKVSDKVTLFSQKIIFPESHFCQPRKTADSWECYLKSEFAVFYAIKGGIMEVDMRFFSRLEI